MVRFTCALTVMHYVVNLLGLELLRLCGAYEARNSARRCSHLDRRSLTNPRALSCTHVQSMYCCAHAVHKQRACILYALSLSLLQARASPLTLRLLALSAVVGFAPGLNNVSLKYNGLGFYQVLTLPLPLPLPLTNNVALKHNGLGFCQVVKLLVTPLIAGAEWSCYGHTLSAARALALTAVCLGVGVAVVSDVTINAAGAAASAAWLPVAAAYKVRSGDCSIRLIACCCASAPNIPFNACCSLSAG